MSKQPDTSAPFSEPTIFFSQIAPGLKPGPRKRMLKALRRGERVHYVGLITEQARLIVLDEQYLRE